MSQEELRGYTQELRNLATSPQALGKKLRAEAVEKVAKKSNAGKTVKASPGKSLDEMMAELEG